MFSSLQCPYVYHHLRTQCVCIEVYASKSTWCEWLHIYTNAHIYTHIHADVKKRIRNIKMHGNIKLQTLMDTFYAHIVQQCSSMYGGMHSQEAGTVLACFCFHFNFLFLMSLKIWQKFAVSHFCVVCARWGSHHITEIYLCIPLDSYYSLLTLNLHFIFSVQARANGVTVVSMVRLILSTLQSMFFRNFILFLR